VDYFTPDIAGAKQLLEAAAFDFDQEIEMKHSNRPVDSDLARVLKAQLDRGGVKIKLVQEDLVTWFSQTLNQSTFKMTCFQHLPYEDPDLPLRFFLGKDETLGNNDNFMKWSDPDVNAAVLAAAQELDEEARVEKVKEAQRVIIKQAAPMVNVLSQQNFGGAYQYVKGAVTGRGSYGLFNRTTWFDDEGRRAEQG
jgi:ABC-type transport system substrate-binding protein